jgi:hypothetical protein
MRFSLLNILVLALATDAVVASTWFSKASASGKSDFLPECGDKRTPPDLDTRLDEDLWHSSSFSELHNP